MAETTTKPRRRVEEASDVEQPGLWHVVLVDDDEHTYEYVIEMMSVVFGHDVARGFRIARTVDEQGRAVCMTTHRELAELKQEQVHGFGADPRMSESKGAMTCVLEPATGGADGGDGADGGGSGGGGSGGGGSGGGGGS